ncbi:hypothetical protein DI09_35p240 [Mitosporidium daphniae]|uniref:Tubulin-specific chaperone A n=1 Tax=Mitosporidium daphniae TaxID=1485682 RepID=A0A098VUT2_9MICR|nr:uncharacterized protein DI09_35p240 [Mitosporidium daphniae]KGG51436.1 hypothetical protein DI09_35p240 [Mitosporidium daphniae]|eukprot:XP_013237863.1 uncharacterized protein DI09_35p240 [Mitosporidium daphniae]
MISDKIDKLFAIDKDDYDIKKQKECLAETRQMIYDSKARLSIAIKNLKNLTAYEQECSDVAIIDSDIFKSALSVIQMAPILQDDDENNSVLLVL